MHIFYAQGGGLGHLTRVDKIIKSLEIPKEKVIIITPSVFTDYFVGYQFVRLLWNEYHFDWTKKIEKVISTNEVTYFYVDTFPFGLKGELNLVYSTFPKLKYIYISRILKWEYYLNAISTKVLIRFKDTLYLEDLYDSHLNWIENHSEKITPLYLDYSQDQSLSLMDEPYVLVVHSGGKEDVLKICNQAIENYKAFPNTKIMVFTQVDIQFENVNIIVNKAIFPVSQYFKHALKIYTACGFNSIQELKAYKEKHVVIAFDKMFDDQKFRLLNS
nr:hypothetical protein [uncultured Psychroserpens sp.]